MVVTTVKKLFHFINMKVNHLDHASPPLVAIPNQMNLSHTLLSYSLQRNFNTIVASVPRNPPISENKLRITCLLYVTFESSMELPFCTDCGFPNFFYPNFPISLRTDLQAQCGTLRNLRDLALEMMTVRGAAVLTVEVSGAAEWIFCVRSLEVSDVPKSFSLLYYKVPFFSLIHSSEEDPRGLHLILCPLPLLGTIVSPDELLSCYYVLVVWPKALAQHLTTHCTVTTSRKMVTIINLMALTILVCTASLLFLRSKSANYIPIAFDHYSINELFNASQT
jgi:hypothetical protein